MLLRTARSWSFSSGRYSALLTSLSSSTLSLSSRSPIASSSLSRPSICLFAPRPSRDPPQITLLSCWVRTSSRWKTGWGPRWMLGCLCRSFGWWRPGLSPPWGCRSDWRRSWRSCRGIFAVFTRTIAWLAVASWCTRPHRTWLLPPAWSPFRWWG